MPILTGNVITIALGRTRQAVQLRDTANIHVGNLHPNNLAMYLDRGYEAHGTARRVRYIKPAEPVVPRISYGPWQECWLTMEAAVIRFHGEAGA